MLIPARRTGAGSGSPASQLFSVVGGDYISPLITSPRALQTLNVQLGSYAHFAGYDQLKALAIKRSTPHFAELVNVTRFCGELLPMLAVQYVLDGRKQVETGRIYLSESYWRRVLGSAPGVVGEAIQLGGESYTVAGVVRASAAFLGETDMWVPICSRGIYGTMTALRVVGALVPGQDWRAGEKEIARLLRAEVVNEQVTELDKVRLLPVERKLVFYPAAAEVKLPTIRRGRPAA